MFQQGFKAEHAAVKPFAHSVLLADVLARRVEKEKKEPGMLLKKLGIKHIKI